jgi:PKD repeat protein
LIAEIESAATVNATLGGVETEDIAFVSTAFHSRTSPDSDADGLNDSDKFVTLVDYLQEGSPVAAFSLEPTSPVKGQLLQFTDISANAPTSWSWDFGDGVGTSSEQNPTYSYLDGGIYTVTLTASNDSGADDFSADVSVSNMIPPTNQYFIPAAALSEGAEGAFFVTDVEVNNIGASAMTYQFIWLPRGEDNSGFETSPAFMLGANMSARYDNVVGEVFGLDEGVGAVAVIADSDAALLMSRTFNQPGEEPSGTFGQGLPGVAFADMTPAGVRERIIFMSENDAFRSNVGCQNGIGKNIRINLELFASDGTSLDVLAMDLRPWSNNQLTRILQDYQPVDVGFVDVWSNTADARFICYGSVLDSETSDPTTILPQ